MRTTVLTGLVVGMLSTTALAQESNANATGQTAPAATASAQPVAPVEPPARVTATVGVDLLSAYLFRGIHQESAGFVAQPPFDVGLNLGKGVSANFGNWASLHSGPTGRFYEADYYGSVTFTAGKLKPGVLFTSYMSPNDRFTTVHEIAAVVAVDDSGSAFPLSPKATLAFELEGQADGGAARGTYLELGMRPGMTVIEGRYPLKFAVPVRLGLSVKDYYEGLNGSDTFGFFSAGMIASVPITTGRVTWDVHGGVDLCWLGDNMKRLNANEAFKPIVIGGVTFSY